MTLQLPSLSALSEWRIDYIEQGEWLRILSGNFTHTNFDHLALNVAGLWVLAFIFRPSSQNYLILLLLLSIAVGIGMLFTTTEAYLGLSGTLHGLFAFYALTEALQGRKSSWLLVVGIIVKIVWEMTIGSPLSSQALINAPVAVEAHLFGLLGGVVFAVVGYSGYKNAP